MGLPEPFFVRDCVGGPANGCVQPLDPFGTRLQVRKHPHVQRIAPALHQTRQVGIPDHRFQVHGAIPRVRHTPRLPLFGRRHLPPPSKVHVAIRGHDPRHHAPVHASQALNDVRERIGSILDCDCVQRRHRDNGRGHVGRRRHRRVVGRVDLDVGHGGRDLEHAVEPVAHVHVGVCVKRSPPKVVRHGGFRQFQKRVAARNRRRHVHQAEETKPSVLGAKRRDRTIAGGHDEPGHVERMAGGGFALDKSPRFKVKQPIVDRNHARHDARHDVQVPRRCGSRRHAKRFRGGWDKGVVGRSPLGPRFVQQEAAGADDAVRYDSARGMDRKQDAHAAKAADFNCPTRALDSAAKACDGACPFDRCVCDVWRRQLDGHHCNEPETAPKSGIVARMRLGQRQQHIVQDVLQPQGLTRQKQSLDGRPIVVVECRDLVAHVQRRRRRAQDDDGRDAPNKHERSTDPDTAEYPIVLKQVGAVDLKLGDHTKQRHRDRHDRRHGRGVHDQIPKVHTRFARKLFRVHHKTHVRHPPRH
ncbi:hypothetical protein H310_13166 [Aphanomyces invadans]|uniref:Uncharacterized protein n=1 Tax=Aphanomyces invadans TaxID=157072 RepID=A0A024TFW3_9STRA|nr:hypothetical protein H310_13166 [Aphanomyces invadans]ETV92476.1 hypothetical protein H310_13166 [Aphanomyces invadans]|eukprot:XP_008878783.1 hypothetical protein H310_13166 [Aphanomyces invadans]